MAVATEGEKCKPCKRSGLPLLIVLPSVIDQRASKDLADTKIQFPSALDSDFAGFSRQASVPVVRTVREGFIYVFYQDHMVWDIWRVMPNGLTRRVMHQVSSDDYAQYSGKPSDGDFACSQGVANLKANLIAIEQAASQNDIWLAFAEHRWTPAILKNYEAGNNRAARMRHIQPKNWIASGAAQAHTLLLTSENLESHVSEFAAPPAAGRKFSQLNVIFQAASHPFDNGRLGLARAMDDTARAIEKATNSTPSILNKSLIVLLHDAVGVMEEHNQLRLLASAQKQQWAQGGPDQNGKAPDSTRPWQIASSGYVETIDSWVVAREMQWQEQLLKNYYKDHIIVPKDQADRMQKDGSIPAGSTITSFNTDAGTMVRITYSSEYMEKGAMGSAKADSQDKIKRYHKHVNRTALDEFRKQFKSDSDAWDALIGKLDRDFVNWRNSATMQLALSHDFDLRLTLKKPSKAQGTIQQQVEDYFSRLAAIDKAWSGGAVSEASAQSLIQQFSKNGSDPSGYFNPLVKPFDLQQVILSDANYTKESVEDLAGIRDVNASVRQAMKAQSGSVINSVLTTHHNAVMLAVTALDADQAKALGVIKTAIGDADRFMLFNVRTHALMDAILNYNVQKGGLASIRLSLPAKGSLSRTANAFLAKGHAPAVLELRDSPEAGTRKTVRWQNAMREVQSQVKAGKIAPSAVPEEYPILVSRRDLAQLAELAQKSNEPLVKVTSDPSLGGLSEPFELPQSVAFRLVDEQAALSRTSLIKVATSADSIIGFTLAVFQIRALWVTSRGLGGKDGAAYADSVLSIFTAAAGLTESTLTLGAAVYELKFDDVKLALTASLQRLRWIRLGAGLAGAAASTFSATAAYLQALKAGKQGDATAAKGYLASSGAYTLSAVSLTVAAGFRLYAIRQVATASAVGGAEAAATAVEASGAALAAEGIATTLSGVGLVLGLIGFALLLYALSLESDLNEIFLDRSYFGVGKRQEGKFGGRRPATPKDIKVWADRGFQQESDAFKALAVGIKATLEWDHHWFDPDALSADLLVTNWPEGYNLNWAIALGGTTLANGQKITNLKKTAGGLWELSASATVPGNSTTKAAAFSYQIYSDAAQRCREAGDTLNVKRD